MSQKYECGKTVKDKQEYSKDGITIGWELDRSENWMAFLRGNRNGWWTVVWSTNTGLPKQMHRRRSNNVNRGAVVQ